MKKLLVYGLALLSVTGPACASLAKADSPKLQGSWNVTFYLDPGRSTGATQCIVFKQTSGTVGGAVRSGTWTSPTFAGWSGQWIQLGDHVRWFGVTTGGLATEESGNIENFTNLGGVSFNHFFTSDGVTSSAGSWQAVRVARCMPGYATSSSKDPSRLK